MWPCWRMAVTGDGLSGFQPHAIPCSLRFMLTVGAVSFQLQISCLPPVAMLSLPLETISPINPLLKKVPWSQCFTTAREKQLIHRGSVRDRCGVHLGG